MPRSPALELQDRLIAAMTPAQKVAISESLRQTARELKAAWIASRNPVLTPEEVEAEVRRMFVNASA